MYHEPYVRFVNTHAESIGGNHHAGFAFHPALLLAVAFARIQSGMVIVGGDTVIAQEISGFRCFLTVAHIYDTRAGIAVHDPKHPAVFVLLVNHKIGQIAPFEAFLEDIFGLEVDSGKQDIVTGKIGINFAWSGDAVYSMEQAEEEKELELYYSIPNTGSNIWMDAWCMPKSDQRSQAQRELAELFLDFLSIPEYTAQNMSYTGYTPFTAGNEILDLTREKSGSLIFL